MAPRAYNTETRKLQQAELRSRIAAAAAELHAEKGVLGTSYADIAQRAGVSLPTVYNHFPSQHELIAACTGHVASRAPELPVGEILAAPSLAECAAALVAAMERSHLHYEPWMSWGEKRLVPALLEQLEAARKEQAALVAELLAAHLGAGDHRETAAVWETLLSFDTWHRLSREHKLPRSSVRQTLHHLLLAAAGPRPAASNSRPAPRK